MALLGWLLPWSRCRECGLRLGLAFPVLEVATAAVFGLLAWRIGPTPALPAFLYLGAVGVVLTVVDIEVRRLPDAFTLPSYMVGAALLGLAAVVGGSAGPYVRALAAAAVLLGLYAAMAMLGPAGGMGGGDVKLAGVLGLYLGWLGWPEVLVGTLLAFGLGAGVGLLLLLLRRANRTSAIPFGPCMVAGSLATVVWGPQLLQVMVGR